VKGFAVTLSLGIAASMFTAIFGTRLLFDYLLQKRRMKTLSI
jgi:preprotein translocase subunit SecD